ncbi:hypothetical protein ACNFJN_18430 [Xenorhabdus budapestensis]|uniref:hypothetical protein n=1 Tax=Xenorhabdus budapestensis TaxID=290110 RepID=UPI003A8A9D31
MSTELYRMEAQVYNIRDADIFAIMRYFKGLWYTGKNIGGVSAPESNKKFGKIIDVYDVTGVNCTTHSVKALNFAVTITAIDVNFGHALPLKGGKHITTTNYLIHDQALNHRG